MFVVVLVIVVSALTGCAKPPQVEIDAVKVAVENAEAADAATYAPAELEAAREAQRAAAAEVEAQNARFALTRNYEKATGMLQQASTAAETAKTAAVANREAAIAAANEAVASITAQLATAEADLGALAACRKKPKGFAQDLELMRGRIDALKSQLTELQAQVAAERYLAATDFAKAMEPELATVATDLTNVRTKLGC
jgi:hypothetical protein